VSAYILTCNAGSNSLKSALYTADGPDLRYRFLADRIHDHMTLEVKDCHGETIATDSDVGTGYEKALTWMTDFLHDRIDNFRLAAAGHRIVHGGPYYAGPVVVNQAVMTNLAKLNPLAPSHQPHNLSLIEALKKLDPSIAARARKQQTLPCPGNWLKNMIFTAMASTACRMTISPRPWRITCRKVSANA